MKKIWQWLKEGFKQPKQVNFKIIPPLEMDLSGHHNDLGYFFEEVVAPDNTNQLFVELKKGTASILADNAENPEKIFKEGIIKVAYDEKETAPEEIQKNLKKLGINTKII